MKSLNRYAGIDPYVLSQIRYHARSLTRYNKLPSLEVEDIEQELLLEIFNKTPAYDPRKASWATFVDRILHHKISNLIQKARTQKRGRGLPSLSLDTLLESGEGEAKAFLHCSNASEQSLYLAIDLNRVEQSLPTPLLALLQQLRCHTPSEIAHMSHISRAALYHSLHLLRKELRRAALHYYLQ